MKKYIILSLFLLISLCTYSQTLPYNWYPGNPGWVSSNPSVNTLRYQSGCYGYVSTSDCTGSGSWYSYNNSQITSYTSPVYNFSCASSLTVSFNLDVNLGDRGTGPASTAVHYDWFYFEYSLDGGTTWINPVALNTRANGSGINMSSYSPLTTWVNTNSNRNGWTGAIGSLTATYTIPNSSQLMFRFIFESDVSVNTSGSGIFISIYYVDILSFNISCLTPLPIELISFNGLNDNSKNLLTWSTASEYNNDFFTIERSIDGNNWEIVSIIDGVGTSTSIMNYSYLDYTFTKNSINYYRLKQTDFNGQYKYSSIIAIDNQATKYIKSIITYDIMGQEAADTKPGMYIQHIEYSDKTIETKKIIIQ